MFSEGVAQSRAMKNDLQRMAPISDDKWKKEEGKSREIEDFTFIYL